MTTPPSLYDESFHKAACGLGFVARMDNRASHEIVEQGLVVLENLAHRGAAGADELTGDGAGILVQLPHDFLVAAAREAGFELPAAGWYGAGACFVWSDDAERERCEALMAMIAAEEGQRVIGWRDVPVDPSGIGELALAAMPQIRQVFIERRIEDREAFERKLYLIRRRFHRTVQHAFGERDNGQDRYYVVSLSSRTMVYKGLLQGNQVTGFYPDLSHPKFASAMAMVHSRFSTNTSERWSLAHPYRYIAHNGEINTLRGNLNWMRAREAQLESPLFGHDIPKLHPIIEPEVSDSAAFDNALEFLHMGGRSLPQAIMTMVPEAWESNTELDAERRAFYAYSQSLMQPWDGPAAIAFSDGRIIGGALDRNGLRPARYAKTRDGLVVMASEDGVLPIDASDITERWRLGPGRMMVVDLERHRLDHDSSVKGEVVRRHPYRQWVFDNAITLDEATAPVDTAPIAPSLDELAAQHRAFGYTSEEIRLLLTPMGATGAEADGSMGTDTPLAVLSDKPRLVFDYFHQLFAQVTNPPIDPLRERLVMSLRVSIGEQHNLLEDGEHHARRITLASPVLTNEQTQRIADLQLDGYSVETVPLTFSTEGTLTDAVNELCRQVVALVKSGTNIVVLDDSGLDEQTVAIPSLIATGAVRQALIDAGLGAQAALIVSASDAREVHHIACLLAFGADAVNPALALDTVAALNPDHPEKAFRNYVKASNKGLLKIISKMGISTLHSYAGSQLFEAVGINHSVMQRCFRRAVSRVGGLTMDDLGRDLIDRHNNAWNSDFVDAGGDYQLREQGTAHMWNERTIPALQRAVRSGDFKTFEEFARYADDQSTAHFALRSLLEFKPSKAIPIADVEPATEIVKRFNTGAMSLGSISRESHEAIAIAMNRIGGRSNSGEGGESELRFRSDNVDSKRSAIKQVASARFGVTANYLVNADMLQIKVAQGAKPGEGGQLPGHKVSAEIAELRHSTPGVGLISPPPHHDIYSIEDLSQLIFDLKMVSPGADVSVKLVSEAGVGTIAAGVAKAKADHVTISGFDGGTGAAMQSSIKHAGLPWELGLAETQQVLVDNKLRGRIRVQVDGQLKTGRDVIIGALLGADEFGFSTAPLVAMGCVMMRVCHLNTCPVGIATQDPELRKRFKGSPENVINYFFFVAEQVRQLMAQLGVAKFEDLIGRVDLLQRSPQSSGSRRSQRNADKLDLTALLRPHPDQHDRSHITVQRHLVEDSFDATVLDSLQPALVEQQPVVLDLPVSNVHRSVGAMISGKIARRQGSAGLADDTIILNLTGVGGQSFGAWGAHGLTLNLTGTTNDYAGKGLSGARIVVKPPTNAGYATRLSTAVGNVALYGATSGEAYFAGLAGERFAVRNSGAVAVVEGVGDHGCEYMTGGTVVVLGPTGRNFAAGMSGGIAYVYDPSNSFSTRCNLEMVSLVALDDSDGDVLGPLLRNHFEYTGSTKARSLLDDWSLTSAFKKVLPNDLAKARAALAPSSVEVPA